MVRRQAQGVLFIIREIKKKSKKRLALSRFSLPLNYHTWIGSLFVFGAFFLISASELFERLYVRQPGSQPGAIRPEKQPRAFFLLPWTFMRIKQRYFLGFLW